MVIMDDKFVQWLIIIKTSFRYRYANDSLRRC